MHPNPRLQIQLCHFKDARQHGRGAGACRVSAQRTDPQTTAVARRTPLCMSLIIDDQIVALLQQRPLVELRGRKPGRRLQDLTTEPFTGDPFVYGGGAAVMQWRPRSEQERLPGGGSARPMEKVTLLDGPPGSSSSGGGALATKRFDTTPKMVETRSAWQLKRATDLAAKALQHLGLDSSGASTEAARDAGIVSSVRERWLRAGTKAKHVSRVVKATLSARLVATSAHDAECAVAADQFESRHRQRSAVAELAYFSADPIARRSLNAHTQRAQSAFIREIAEVRRNRYVAPPRHLGDRHLGDPLELGGKPKSPRPTARLIKMKPPTPFDVYRSLWAPRTSWAESQDLYDTEEVCALMATDGL